MTELQLEAAQADLRSLRELEKSRGWGIVQERIRKDVTSACFAMAENANMTEKEIDFRRGAIHAAKGLTEIVAHLIAVQDNDVVVAQAEQELARTLTSTPHATA